jgi:DNA-binding PadR family transcriptional regulator
MGNILYAMKFNIDPAVGQLFGSETRAKVLGVLANSLEPKTGYEISKTLDISPPKVYDVLKRLETSGFLKAVRGRSRSKRYFLADEDLRRLVLKRVRIAVEKDWFSPEMEREREKAFELARKLVVRVPKAMGIPKSIPNRREFMRPPEKDRALARIVATP